MLPTLIDLSLLKGRRGRRRESRRALDEGRTDGENHVKMLRRAYGSARQGCVARPMVEFFFRGESESQLTHAVPPPLKTRYLVGGHPYTSLATQVHTLRPHRPAQS